MTLWGIANGLLIPALVAGYVPPRGISPDPCRGGLFRHAGGGSRGHGL